MSSWCSRQPCLCAAKGAKGNHGLYIDSPVRLAFIACEGNDRLLVLDLASRKVLASFDVAKGPDVLAFDLTLGWLYVAGESGQLSIFKVQAKTVAALATAQLGPNAHVVAVDPVTHEAFFPLKPHTGNPCFESLGQAQKGDARLRRASGSPQQTGFSCWWRDCYGRSRKDRQCP